jgi:hypothetical protein
MIGLEKLLVNKKCRKRLWYESPTCRQAYASLAATMVRWCEGGVNQALLPMAISEEESNLFHDEGKGQ